MRAIVQDRYGTSETLYLADIAQPSFGVKEVLVQVEAASVDAGVLHLMTAEIPMVRLAFGLRKPRRRPGMTFSGIVKAVGANVDHLVVGDRVLGTAPGTFAEVVSAKSDHVSLLPKRFGFLAGATLPVSASTAFQAVVDHAKVKEVQKVLVTGASGGVGGFVVRIASILGAEVTAVCRGEKSEYVRSLGADKTIDYHREEISGTYDCIIDIASPLPLGRTVQLIQPTGTLVIVGVASQTGSSGMARNFGANFRSRFSKQNLLWFIQSENRKDLDKLVQFLSEEEIEPKIDKSFLLEQTVEAIQHFASGVAKGMTVIAIGEAAIAEHTSNQP
jgi:NADPH:quinone reductase-like Zn-dependent oxidoreductase